MNKPEFPFVPEHIAIIMDGNGRWARSRGLDTLYGHQEGAERVKDICSSLSSLGVSYLSLFAFSTENWQRPEKEVDALMQLLVSFLKDQEQDMMENGIVFMYSGRKNSFSPEIVESLEHTVSLTSANKGLKLILNIDYGGRSEIIDAASKKEHFEEEEDFNKCLYLPAVPDVDLLIRTSGENRISNYMLWQISYAELYFTETLWPDFKEQELINAIFDYTSRQRRYGRRV